LLAHRSFGIGWAGVCSPIPTKVLAE